MHTLKVGVLVIVAALSASASAQAAAFHFSFNTGDVAFAYQDGWWDSHHHWHRWKNHREFEAYRQRYHDHYSDWRHDRDPDHGWHHH